MATYRKLKSGKWFAEVTKKNADNKKTIRKTRTGYTKSEVQKWAKDLEKSISDGSYWKVDSTGKTLEDLLIYYAENVSPKKRSGGKKEVERITRFIREESVSQKPLREITTLDFVEWRDRRLTQVQSSTVNRELNLISHIFTIARDELSWIAESPTTKLKRPKDPHHRDRRISDEEIESILHVLCYDPDIIPSQAIQRLACAFLFAIETGMRSGEICALTPSDIFLSEKYVLIRKSKNGKARKVPLSKRARKLIKQVMLCEMDKVFGLSDSSRDALWRKYRDQAGIVDLHWHDTRHEACTRLAGKKKMNVLTLARMLGMTDLKKLMIYFNETPEEISKRL